MITIIFFKHIGVYDIYLPKIVILRKVRYLAKIFKCFVEGNISGRRFYIPNRNINKIFEENLSKLS